MKNFLLWEIFLNLALLQQLKNIKSNISVFIPLGFSLMAEIWLLQPSLSRLCTVRKRQLGEGVTEGVAFPEVSHRLLSF